MRDADTLRVLIAEVEDDLRAAGEIQRRVSEKLDQLADRQPDFFELGALGYCAHNFYNACEGALVRIARVFENRIDSDQWHVDLLQRMRLEVEEVRPAVIDVRVCRQLDELRRFRHLFRHSYGFDLEWQKLSDVLEQVRRVYGPFVQQMSAFLQLSRELIQRLEHTRE